MLPKFRTPIIVFLISTFLFPISGCKLNKTLKKLATAVTDISIIVRVPPGVTTGAAVLALILELKKSDDPNTDPNSIDPNSIIVDPNNNTATIPIHRNDTNDPNLHVGISLKDPGMTNWEILGTYVQEGNTPMVEVVSAPNLKVRQDHDLGRVLDVINPSGLTLRVTNLEVAVSTMNIPLGELNYYDPNVSSFTWLAVISTATDFFPGETKTFDVSDDTLYGLWLYARAQYGPSSGVGPSGDIVYAFFNSDVIPTLSEWGMIIMAISLLVAGAIVIVRRSRMITA